VAGAAAPSRPASTKSRASGTDRSLRNRKGQEERP
jgi:hypothetical protein